jgi:hypothetical protein
MECITLPPLRILYVFKLEVWKKKQCKFNWSKIKKLISGTDWITILKLSKGILNYNEEKITPNKNWIKSDGDNFFQSFNITFENYPTKNKHSKGSHVSCKVKFHAPFPNRSNSPAIKVQVQKTLHV